jgi:transposase
MFKIAMVPPLSSRPSTNCFRGCDTSLLTALYNGPNLRDALAKFGNWTIEIVKRATDAAGFQLLPRRWVVERTLAWLNRNRRLAKDFEASIASAKAWVYIASVQLLIRRLA